MSPILVRGIPASIRRQILHLAAEQNLSMNQEILRLLKVALEKEKERREKEKERQDVFNRMEELRKRMYAKYGKREESWRLIREMREERMRRYE